MDSGAETLSRRSVFQSATASKAPHDDFSPALPSCRLSQPDLRRHIPLSPGAPPKSCIASRALASPHPPSVVTAACLTHLLQCCPCALPRSASNPDAHSLPLRFRPVLVSTAA